MTVIALQTKALFVLINDAETIGHPHGKHIVGRLPHPSHKLHGDEDINMKENNSHFNKNPHGSFLILIIIIGNRYYQPTLSEA